MKAPSFFEGVVVALAFSVSGGVLYSVLSSAFPAAAVLRLLIAGVGLGYVFYLLSRSRERVGRITAVACWTLATGVIWFIGPPLIVYILTQLGLIWLIRSLYFYSSGLSAMADLMLQPQSGRCGLGSQAHGQCFSELLVFLPDAIPVRLHSGPL